MEGETGNNLASPLFGVTSVVAPADDEGIRRYVDSKSCVLAIDMQDFFRFGEKGALKTCNIQTIAVYLQT